MKDIMTLIYASKISDNYRNSGEVENILRVSRSNNSNKHITGILLCNLRYFLQLLEGPRDAVEALYGKIVCDNRHHNVTLITKKITGNRTCTAWHMAFSKPQANQSKDSALDWTELTERQAVALLARALEAETNRDSRTVYPL